MDTTESGPVVQLANISPHHEPTHSMSPSKSAAAQAAPPIQPIAGPSTTPTILRKAPARKPARKKHDHVMAYTSAYVPSTVNIKNPAGDFMQRDNNVDVTRQVALQKKNKRKAEAELEKQRMEAEGQEVPLEPNPLPNILIIHPGSTNLRIGRASDFYPKEVPMCIARPGIAVERGLDLPVVPGERGKRFAEEERRKRTGDVDMNNGENEEEAFVDPIDTKIGYLRDYLRNRLRQNKLTTDYREGTRVIAANQRTKSEPIPEHNDPYRIDWTEVDKRPYIVGTEALRIPESKGYRVRYPILNRTLNKRDWRSAQLLLGDIATIIQEALKTELGISLRDYHKYSVVFIVPDHGDREYIQEMTNLFLGVMGFKEIALHQEAYTAIFSTGMSSACVVDIGATRTSVTVVDEGVVIEGSRNVLDYGGDDITLALTILLGRSAFPFRELDLAKTQDWLMMDNLKIKICTLEEHLVANTSWDFHVLKMNGLTQKYGLRTYDENILAPLIFFDTRMIDHDEKKGTGSVDLWGKENIDDMVFSIYGEPTAAMRGTLRQMTAFSDQKAIEPTIAHGFPIAGSNGADSPAEGVNESRPPEGDEPVKPNSTEPVKAETASPTHQRNGSTNPTPNQTPAPEPQPEPEPSRAPEDFPIIPEILSREKVFHESGRYPLDAALAASIGLAGSENKVKIAAASILLVGGGSLLKGLGPFISERLRPLLRAKGHNVDLVQTVPPPRNLNPKWICWKGASVMCQLESLQDVWVGKEEWDMVGFRAVKERYLFL